MRNSKLLIVAASVLLTLLAVELWGQGVSRPAASLPAGAFQVSAAASGPANISAYVIDTRNGRVWYIRGTEPAKLVGDTADADTPPQPPRN